MSCNLPKEINGESVDRLCLDTAELFAKYDINLMKNETLYLTLIETIGAFLEKQCQITIVQKISRLS